MFVISGLTVVHSEKKKKKKTAVKVEFLIKDDLIFHLEITTSPKSLPAVLGSHAGDERRVLACCRRRI